MNAHWHIFYSTNIHFYDEQSPEVLSTARQTSPGSAGQYLPVVVQEQWLFMSLWCTYKRWKVLAASGQIIMVVMLWQTVRRVFVLLLGKVWKLCTSISDRCVGEERAVSQTQCFRTRLSSGSDFRWQCPQQNVIALYFCFLKLEVYYLQSG